MEKCPDWCRRTTPYNDKAILVIRADVRAGHLSLHLGEVGIFPVASDSTLFGDGALLLKIFHSTLDTSRAKFKDAVDNLILTPLDQLPNGFPLLGSLWNLASAARGQHHDGLSR